MKTNSSLIFLVIVLLASCVPAPATINETATTVSISTATALATQVIAKTPVISTANEDEQQSVFRVDEFSEDYYGIVQAENNDEVFKKGWIAIYEKKTGKELIKVSSDRLAFDLHEGKIQANILELPYGEQSLIIYDDFNFDKVKDFAIQDGQNSCYGGPSFKIYLSQNGEFILNEDFTRLTQEYCGMFRVDEKEQKIYTMTKSGCCWHQYSEFIVDNNIPTAQKIVESGWFPPYHILTTKEWNGGKLIETEEKRLSWEDVKDYSVVSFDLLNDSGKVFLFSLNGETLTYAITTKGEVVEFNFPAEKTADGNAKFSYTKEQSRIILRFADKNTEYEIYENINGNKIEKIGVRATTDRQKLILEGDVATIQGDLMDIEKVKWNNVVFDK